MKTKIYKLLSILLTVALVFSCCTVAFSVAAETVSPIYYVSANGSDNSNGSEATPLKTIAGVVFRARDVDGINSPEQTVTVMIKDGETVNWTDQYTKPGYTHDGNDTNDGHKFKLFITSANGASLTTNANDMILDGPVVFGNVKIDTAGKTFRFNGNNVVFSADTTFDSSKIGATSISNSTSQATEQTVEINSHMGKNVLFGSVVGAITYSADINVVYNDADAEAAQELSFGYVGGYAVTYDSNINFNVKAGDVTLKNYNTNTFNGAIQIIDSSANGVKWDASTSGITAPKWILNNTTKQYKDAISFTETAGKYIVNADYNVVATNTATQATFSTQVVDGQKILDLTTETSGENAGVGTYNLTFSKPDNVVYYVSNSGDDSNGGTNATTDAFLTIGGAIKAAVNLGYDGQDIVTVMVPDGQTINWTSQYAMPNLNIGNLPATYDNDGHDFKLIVKSEGGATLSNTQSGGENDITLGGPTEFYNIAIKTNGKTLRFNHRNVKFGEGTTFDAANSYVLLGQTTTVNGPINIEYEGCNPSSSALQLASYSGVSTYKDINITYSSPSATAQNIAFGGLSYASTFDGNVNFDVKSGKIAFSTYSGFLAPTFTANSAIQIIRTEDATVDYEAFVSGKSVPVYVINNNTGDADALEFTGTKGQYKVTADTSSYSVVVKDSEGNAVPAAYDDDIITLSEAGEYTVELERKPVYYVSANGNDSTGNGTKANPYATINKAATDAVNNGGYTTGDKVTVRIIGTDAVKWAPQYAALCYPNSHNFTLVITSDDSNQKATVKTLTDTGNNDLALGGPTEFKNVILEPGATSNKLKLNGYDVKFDADTEISTDFSRFTISSDTEEATVDQTIELNSEIPGKAFALSTSGSSKSYNNNITVIYDVADASREHSFYLGSVDGAPTTYKKNVNFNIKSGHKDGAVKFTQNKVTYDENAAVQIINSSGTTLLNVSAITATNKWIINNNTEDADIITFTDVAGKYNVNVEEGYIVQAYKNETMVAASSGNVLDLSKLEPDEYSIELCEVLTEKTYYVSSGGSDSNGGTNATTDALLTIDGAVRKAVAKGYTTGNTVTVMVSDGDTVNWTPQYGMVNYSSSFESDRYDFQLIVTSVNGATIVPAPSGDAYNDMILGGPTEFRNVTINAQNKTFRFNNQNVKFGEGTKISTTIGQVTLGQNAEEVADAINLEFTNGFNSGSTIQFASFNGSSTYKDINVTYSSESATAQNFALGRHSGSSNTYNGNINFNVKSGSVAFNSNAAFSAPTFGPNAAVQIIKEAGATVDYSTYFAGKSVPVYVINNNIGEANAVAFTGTTGQFSVTADTSSYSVVVKDNSGNAVPGAYDDGIITLSEAGEYTVELERKSVYYVSSTGNDSTGNGTEANPYATIDKAAIDAVNNGGYTTGDVVTVYATGTVNWSNNRDTLAYDANGNCHKYKLVIASADDESPATITTAQGKNMILGGPTEFRNVQIRVTENTLRFNDYDVKFDADTTVAVNGYVTISNSTTEKTTAHNIELNSRLTALDNGGKALMLGTYNAGSKIYSADINVVYNDAANSGTQTIAFGSLSNATGVTYNKNVNFNIKAGTVSIGNSYAHTFGGNAAVQIIKAMGATLQGSDGIKTTNKWILNNNTDKADLITFTDVAGKYTVNVEEGSTVRAYQNGVMVGESSGNVLDLTDTDCTAGEYSIVIYKGATIETYYVSATGSDSNEGSEGSPLKTISGVVFRARDVDGINLPEDEVTVIIKDGETVNWTDDFARPGFTNDGKANDGHNFKLIITSNNGASITTKPNDLFLGGPTVFGKVNIGTAGQKFVFDGKDVTFSTDTTFDSANIGLTGLTATAGEQAAAQTVEINSYIGKDLMLGCYNGNVTYAEDINITYNDADAAGTQYFVLGCYPSLSSTYNKNVNFNFKAGVVGFKYYGATYNGAVQIINSSGSDITGLNLISASNKWIINNTTGNPDAVTFTDTVGVYNVNILDDTSFDVIKDGVIVDETTGGELDLREFGAGNYEIAIKEPAKDPIYYVSSSGNDSTGVAGDSEKTFLTIDGVVLDALEAECGAGDTVTAIVKDGETVAWTTSGTRPAQNVGGYKFDLIIKSENGATVNTNSNDMVLYGPTKFYNVNLSPVGGGFRFNDSTNAVIDENTTITLPDGRYFLLSHTAGTVSSAVNVELKKFVNGKTFMLSNQGGGMIYDADVNITYDDEDATREQTIAFGALGGTNTTFKKNVNFNIKSGNAASGAVKFNNDYPHSFDASAAVQIINSSGTTLQGVGGIKAENKWIINNTTGDADLITFTNTAGTYNVKEGITVCAFKDGVLVATSNDGVLELDMGEYTLGIPHDYQGEETEYEEYIDYAVQSGSALNNFAAKVNAGESVKVVYFGGSVTNGQGASVANSTSWRGIISSWLATNTPNANVTNINRAIGGTSTFFGTYRLNEAVLEEEPDLLFIEFSINDYYDGVSKTEAASRFETIVRTVREKLPECDIVTVLTTDRNQIANIVNSNTLHPQAQGHEKIAKAYGLPIIYVGKALALEEPAFSDGVSDSEWAVYFDNNDIVHPNDNGYRVYANVVKEFMANSLLSDEAKAITEIKEHKAPTMVSASLLDGDIKFIPADQSLLDKSESLGGNHTGIKLNNGTNYAPIATKFYFSDAESILKFKFTGTEIAVIDDGNAWNTFKYRIDGGAWNTKAFSSIQPTVITNGLKYGEHTIEFSVADKSASYDANSNPNQWICGFYTRNEENQTWADARELTYYVGGNNASDSNTGEQNSPFATVDGAVNAAIEENLGSKDIVNVILASGSEVTWATGKDAVTTHSFKLVVTSDNKETVVKSASSKSLTLGGPTEFGKVTIRTDNGFRFNDFDVKTSVDTVVNNTGGLIVFGNDSTADTNTTAQNVEINSRFVGKTAFFSNNNATKEYNADINITYHSDDTANAQTFAFGCYNGKSTIYNNNVNFNIKYGKVTINGNSYANSFGANAAVQVINSSGNAVDLSTVKATYKWVLTNETGNTEVLAFTETAGKYKVADGYEVTATSSDGATTVKSTNGILDLTGKGKYEWTLTTDTAYFEDFDNMTNDEFAIDWRNTSIKATLDSENGKLKVESMYGAFNNTATIENKYINSLDQYISVDIKGDRFTGAGGANLIARLNATNHRESYCLRVTGGRISLTKVNSDATESTGFAEANVRNATAADGVTFSYNENHTYRIGLSVVNVDDYALIRVIVLNVTTNKIMFDETYKDTNPLAGTHIAVSTVGSATEDDPRKEYCITTFDNLYFSSKNFRDGDAGTPNGDVNYDSVYDIRDLVRANEAITNPSVEYNINMTDKDYDGRVDTDDIAIIRQEILKDIVTSEFNLKGNSDAAAETLRNQILGSANTEYNVTGTTYYVSANGTGDGKTEGSPMNLNALHNMRGTLKSGDAVLFKRGDVFTLQKPITTEFTINDDYNIHAYIEAVNGVTYGAYGDPSKAKPLFKDSPKDYADVTWTETSEGSNIWYCYAPDIYIADNNVYDNGAAAMIFNKDSSNPAANANVSMGQRKEYINGFYNLSKNGQFTYDSSNDPNGDRNLYLYCDKGNPADVYSSIEVTRAINGISLGTYKPSIFDSSTGVSNILIDNLAFEGFSGGAIVGQYKNSNITVTNCTIGYSGGVQKNFGHSDIDAYNRLGNAVGIWEGGENFVVSNNWIYQTWDSAISPQGNVMDNDNYDGFVVTNNLLEYNNCDIEVFDNGKDNTSSFKGWNFSNNIMRFTSLGWGSREADGSRGIQGVIRGGTKYADAEITFSENTIDSPGMEIFNFDNTDEFVSVEYDASVVDGDVTKATTVVGNETVNATVDIATSVFDFDGGSTISNNTYYLNSYVRNIPRVMRGYITQSDLDELSVAAGAQDGYLTYSSYPEYYKEVGYQGKLTLDLPDTDRKASSETEFVSIMNLIDAGSTFNWIGKTN